MRRSLLMLAVAVPVAEEAAALPRAPTAAERAVVVVEEPLIKLPRLFGRGEQRNEAAQTDTALRLDQLEARVRSLTGQIETLTFRVRELEAALNAGGAAAPSAATSAPLGQRTEVRPGPGAPPRTLGTLPAGAAEAPAVGAPSGSLGPIDLSAINRGLDRAPQPSEPAAAVREPVRNDAVSEVRSLFQSGRYAMAAQRARGVLADNPTGPVAGEARFWLGEALFAQGDYRDAANLFLENYTSDPSGARAPASLIKLGVTLNELGEREAACSSLEELFGAYPDVDATLRAEAEAARQAANCA